MESEQKVSPTGYFPETFEKYHLCVIPAQAGIQSYQKLIDSRLRGNDNVVVFCSCAKLSPPCKTFCHRMNRWGARIKRGRWSPFYSNL